MEIINSWIAHYGYAGIYLLLVMGIVGIPVPDETLIAFTGFLVSRGQLSFIPAFFSAFLGSISGITISYFIGKGFGKFVLVKYGKYLHLNQEKLGKAHDWFAKTGRWALVFGYFIPGIRHVVAIMAGSSKLEFREFAVFTYLGGVIWISTFMSIGYFFGEKWHYILESIHHHIILTSIVLFFVFAAAVFIRKKISDRMKTPSEKEEK